MRYLWGSIFCALIVVPAASAQSVKIVGETKYKPHSLVRLRADGADAKAALLWRVHPAKNVQRATNPRGILEFAAHPGTYEVELLVITNAGDGLQVDEARVTIEIEGGGPSPPKPDPKPPGGGKLDPVAALGRIRFGHSGCTATVIGPRRPDGHWDVLTAAHCVNGVGHRGTLVLKDGRSFGLRVEAHQRTPDVAWCITDDAVDDLPYALVADASPPVSTAIWHMGFGVDKPGNREDGTVVQGENPQGQLRMILSVSSGDSGGGIFRTDTNELVSTVCCTTGMARNVSVWGSTTESIRKARPKADTAEIWEPISVPNCQGGKCQDANDTQSKPLPMPSSAVRAPTE